MSIAQVKAMESVNHMSHSADVNEQEMRVETYCQLTSVVHAEERLASTFALQLSEEAVYAAVEDWMKVCCEAGQVTKLEWLLGQLLSSTGADSSNDDGSSSGSSSSYSGSLVAWIQRMTLEKKQQVVQTVIVPALRKMTANQAAQNLLAAVQATVWNQL